MTYVHILKVGTMFVNFILGRTIFLLQILFSRIILSSKKKKNIILKLLPLA